MSFRVFLGLFGCLFGSFRVFSGLFGSSRVFSGLLGINKCVFSGLLGINKCVFSGLFGSFRVFSGLFGSSRVFSGLLGKNKCPDYLPLCSINSKKKIQHKYCIFNYLTRNTLSYMKNKRVKSIIIACV